MWYVHSSAAKAVEGLSRTGVQYEQAIEHFKAISSTSHGVSKASLESSKPPTNQGWEWARIASIPCGHAIEPSSYTMHG